MEMRAFLQALFETGHVSAPLTLSTGEKDEITPQLLEFDRAARLNLAGTAPELNLAVAAWAATLLYRTCQLLILRNLDAAQVADAFLLPCPAARSPETDYSADLFLCYLPDLHEIARRLAADDPLVARIETLTAAWPLSGVGMKGIEPDGIESFIHHPTLRRLYLDRIIERKAFLLARDPRVADWIRASYGAFPELCPELAVIVTEPAPA